MHTSDTRCWNSVGRNRLSKSVHWNEPREGNATSYCVVINTKSAWHTISRIPSKYKLSYPRRLFKGDSNLNDKYVYQTELYEPIILMQVSSKSVEKWASYGHLKNSICLTFSRHFEYLISFQIFFNCLIFSYHLCFSRYAALYIRKMYH